MNRIYSIKDILPLVMVMLLATAGMLTIVRFPTELPLFIYLAVFSIIFILFIIRFSSANEKGVSFFLIIPLYLSAFQNLFIGLFAPDLSVFQLKLLLTANTMYPFILIILIIAMRRSVFFDDLSAVTILLGLAIVIYSIALYPFFGGYFTAIAASMRNLVAPFIFFLLGLAAAQKISINRFFLYIILLGWFIVVFGLLERFIYPDIWLSFNISDLWTKKGIGVAEWSQLPGNLYSSEMIGGVQMRRMVSTYVDPINLGAVLLLIFSVAWFTQKRLLALFVLFCIIVTISKAAFAGLLIFITVWAYYSLRAAWFGAVFLLAAFLASAFLYYSYFYSTGSMIVHVQGFLAAIYELPLYPFGRGLGNIGVLPGLFFSGRASNITESGLGLIIGQTGFIGAGLFVYFCYRIFQKIFQKYKKPDERRTKIFLFTLLYSAFFNIIFNEVALSPNSCAGYFMLLGLYCATNNFTDHETPLLVKLPGNVKV